MVELYTLEGKELDFTWSESKLYKKLFLPLDTIIENIDDGDVRLEKFIAKDIQGNNIPIEFETRFVQFQDEIKEQ